MPPLRIVFCADPLAPREPDAAFAREAAACRALGLPWSLIDHDELDRRRDAEAAVARASLAPGPAAYRGWMLRAGDYALLHGALAARGVRLVTAPERYAACHHWPEALPWVAAWAPRTACVPLERIDDAEAVRAALAPFGGGAVVVKDWVKSQAGYWDEACFVPDSGDMVAVGRVVARFRDLQGASLVGGLVFKAYVPLARAGAETEEWRTFVLDGRPLGVWPRFRGAAEPPPPDLVAAVAAALPGRFAAADLARRADGGWLLVEVGDGQVSGIPDAADPADVLGPLAAALSRGDAP